MKRTAILALHTLDEVFVILARPGSLQTLASAPVQCDVTKTRSPHPSPGLGAVAAAAGLHVLFLSLLASSSSRHASDVLILHVRLQR